MKALVTTVLTQELEVPEGATRHDVLDFLADHQRFNEAFAGVSDPDQQFRILNIVAEEDTVIQLGEEAYDD